MNRPDKIPGKNGSSNDAFLADVYVSTQQVAEALGVSVTTVKRWVDQGILPAQRTAGGHRKLPLSELLRLVRRGDLPQPNLEILLGVAIPSTSDDLQQLAQQVRQAAFQHDHTLLRALIRGAYTQGIPMADLADCIIVPMMRAVGHGWETGTLDVMQEHRITQEVAAVLYELRELLRSGVDRHRPRAVGGAPEHDHYLLPTLLAQLTLLDCGWQAINLGPHTPPSAFQAAVEEFRPRLVWLSVTHLVHPENFLAEFNPLARQWQKQGIIIVVGGQALTPERRNQLVYTSYGDGFRQLAALAHSVVPPPAPPRRGRPPLERS
ncbi:MAG: helix-turn-helix domain-containing protein [Gemmataceae bacterium]|nr:helix-turn-helix domain-containing protein [Gemmataceae bacterium]MCS7271872.1 helix-turn-helix domain-containing protein [Gemmataceae bacterium]MDW8241792.1 helix-turn-helix domain-containing protein [Thermogemmata sp.]